MSHLKPSYDDEELKGSVDFDFFNDGTESSRKAEDDAAQASARSSNLSQSNRSQPPTARSTPRAAADAANSSPRQQRRSPSTPRSRRSCSPKDYNSDVESGSDREDKPRSSRGRSRSRSRSSHSSRSQSSKSSRSKNDKSRSRSNSSRSSSSASDVTDVSPLSSPRNRSPRAAIATGNAAGTSSSGKPPRHAAAANNSHLNAEERDEDRINMETIVRALVELDKRRCQSAGPHRTGFHSGTQSMSRIHDIEAENQRLLYSLMRTKNRTKKPNNIDPPVKRPHHSTVNRQKEQRRIEEENRKIFQRLKQIRPTRGMSRDEMITDYKRQASFGLPLSLLGEEVKYRAPRITQNPYCQPVSRVHSSSSLVRPGTGVVSSSRGRAPGAAAASGSGTGAAGGNNSAASTRPSSAASGGARGSSGGRSRGGDGGGGRVSSGRPGWPAGW